MSATPPPAAPASGPRPVPLWKRPIAGHALFYAGLLLCVAYFFSIGPDTDVARVRVENAIKAFAGAVPDAKDAYKELSDAFTAYNRLRVWETVFMVLSVALMGAGRLWQVLGSRL